MTLPLPLLVSGILVLFAIIAILALAFYGPPPSLEEQRKREILDAHREYRNRKRSKIEYDALDAMTYALIANKEYGMDLANGPDRTVKQMVRVIQPGVTMIENDDLCPRNILLTRALIGDPEKGGDDEGDR